MSSGKSFFSSLCRLIGKLSRCGIHTYQTGTYTCIYHSIHIHEYMSCGRELAARSRFVEEIDELLPADIEKLQDVDTVTIIRADARTAQVRAYKSPLTLVVQCFLTSLAYKHDKHLHIHPSIHPYIHTYIHTYI